MKKLQRTSQRVVQICQFLALTMVVCFMVTAGAAVAQVEQAGAALTTTFFLLAASLAARAARLALRDLILLACAARLALMALILML